MLTEKRTGSQTWKIVISPQCLVLNGQKKGPPKEPFVYSPEAAIQLRIVSSMYGNGADATLSTC